MVAVAYSEYCGHSDDRERVRLASAKADKAPAAEMQGNTRYVAGSQACMPKSRSVSFFPGVSVRECLHINNYTDEEVYNTWYKKADFSRIKTSFIYIIQKLSDGSWEGDTENETARGLEYRTRQGSMARKVNKLNGLMIVLDEQESQWNRGINDDEAIAVPYRDASYKSLEVVRLLAAQDEKEVIEMWADDIDFVSKKLGAVKVGTPGKRAYTTPEHEEQKKKIRLKQFMKQIQVDQRARNRHPP